MIEEEHLETSHWTDKNHPCASSGYKRNSLIETYNWMKTSSDIDYYKQCLFRLKLRSQHTRHCLWINLQSSLIQYMDTPKNKKTTQQQFQLYIATTTQQRRQHTITPINENHSKDNWPLRSSHRQTHLSKKDKDQKFAVFTSITQEQLGNASPGASGLDLILDNLNLLLDRKHQISRKTRNPWRVRG